MWLCHTFLLDFGIWNFENNMVEFWEVLGVMLLSTLKHTLVGVPSGFAAGFGMLEVILYTAIGGAVGVFFFMYFASSAKKAYLWFLKKRGVTPRKFTKTNRFIVRVKQRFGLYGLAFITPPLISVPVGAIVVATIYKNKARAFAFLVGGVLFWSVIGSCIIGPIAKLIAGN